MRPTEKEGGRPARVTRRGGFFFVLDDDFGVVFLDSSFSGIEEWGESNRSHSITDGTRL
jgi:hypothetical protein